MIPIKGSKFFLDENDHNVSTVVKKFGDKYSIEAIWGVSARLHKLEPNQKVIWGGGETYHFRLTAKS